MPNVAKFKVHEDAWGYRVEPKRRDLLFDGGLDPVIVVENNISKAGVTIEVEVDRTDVAISNASGNSATKGGKAVIVHDKNDRPVNPFDVLVWVRPGNVRARAHSDPRVRPK